MPEEPLTFAVASVVQEPEPDPEPEPDEEEEEEEEEEELCDVCNLSTDACCCVTCSARRCSNRTDSPCSNCEMCRNCCVCYTCEDCDEPCITVCTNSRCSNCCEETCEHDSQFVEHVRRELRFFPSSTFKENPIRRFISLEVEVNSLEQEGTQIWDTARTWRDSIVGDGSLDDNGIEINTQPTNGDSFLKHIRDIYDAVEQQGGDPSHTNCGLHVHIDVSSAKAPDKSAYVPSYYTSALVNLMYTRRKDLVSGSEAWEANENQIHDYEGYMERYNKALAEHMRADQSRSDRKFSWFDIKNLTILYDMVEPALFELCAPRRLTGSYSKPCGQMYLNEQAHRKGYKKNLLSSLYGESPEGSRPISAGRNGRISNHDKNVLEGREEKYHVVRYNALNLHSFFHRGTIEFRHKEGVSNAQEAINWALTCAYIIEASMDIPAILEDKSRNSLEKMSKLSPHAALLSILPEELRRWAISKWGRLPRRDWATVWANSGVNRYSPLANDLASTPKLYTYNYKGCK